MIDYKKRFVEVDEILKNYDKSKKITAQNLHRDTIAILSYINTEFILENEQKMLMRKIHYFNELKNKK